jgi:hypothetical protein
MVLLRKLWNKIFKILNRGEKEQVSRTRQKKS